MSDWANRIGIYAAGRLSAGLPGIIFREQRGGDTGLNAHLEVLEEYPRTGKVVGLQIRSGGHESIERTARGYVCRGEMAHVAYWLQHSLPVLVMIYERERDRLVWETVLPETIEITGQQWDLLVPYDQVYGPESVQKIADLPCYSPYLARLAVDRPWMQLIDSGRRLLLEMDEWINQPSARGSLRLSVLGGEGKGEGENANININENRESVYEWPFQTNPDMPHVFRLASLFPWAFIETDPAFYQEKTGTAPEPGALLPWTVEAGEIARFRLRLSLNELGRSFLTTEQFLCRGDFPMTEQSGTFGPDYEKGIKFRLFKKS